MFARRIWFPVSVCAALLAGCAKSPEATLESFYKAVSKGEVTEAQGYFSARVVDMLGKDKLSAQLSRQATYVQNCGGIKNVEVKLDGEGEVRSGKVTLTYAGNCRPETEKAELVKEDGSWKISEK